MVVTLTPGFESDPKTKKALEPSPTGSKLPPSRAMSRVNCAGGVCVTEVDITETGAERRSDRKSERSFIFAIAIVKIFKGFVFQQY